MLKFIKKLFSSRSIENERVIEENYFIKYSDVLDKQVISQMLEEYKTGIIVFEPIRKTLTEADQEDLYSQIDKSNLLSHQEKFETIIGLMMILDGSFPEATIVSRLGNVFGKEFMDTIENKRNEFKTDIAIKRTIKFLANQSS
jgi:hypothetical protein